MEENENPAIRSNQEQEIYKAIKRQKVVESQTMAVGVDAGEEACGKNPTEKGDIRTGKKVYRPPITSTYKETEFFEELNNSIEWVLRYYRRPLKQTKDPCHIGMM